MSSPSFINLAGDDDDEVIAISDTEDILDYDTDATGPDIITIEDDDAEAETETEEDIRIAINLVDDPRKYFVDEYECGDFVIKVGLTVELKDASERAPEKLHSGDFLRVKTIVQDKQTEEVKVRGYRLRRTKYHGQMLDWKLNELVMILHVRENDARSPYVQGLEDVAINDVIGVRQCLITNKSYSLLNWRHFLVPAFYMGKTKEETKRSVFHEGRLVCRWLNVLVIHKNGKPYGGVVRHMYSHEADARSRSTESSRTASIVLDEDEDVTIFNHRAMRAQGRRARGDSTETLDIFPKKERKGPNPPTKRPCYTYGDAFCGAGGASQGAVQADLHVLWGLDHDHHAIQAFAYNHPDAKTFLMNAHDFPLPGTPKNELRVDILHLSPPCNYWSPAHTVVGRNDQANYEAIYTVGAILLKLKPRVATLEQTFGLATYGEHKQNFLILLGDITKAGYDLRYEIQDMCEFGLPQRRKRLLVIAARRGTALPPFPKPTHGPGLRRYTSVADALSPLERVGHARASQEMYHNPLEKKMFNKPPYDPNTSFLKGCITTGGGENWHYSGLREYTAREYALLQTFPYKYQFSGGHSEAKKQIGNAFPPVMAQALFNVIAQTLEAFDNGFIGPEDDLVDLHAFLADKGIQLPECAPQAQAQARSLLNSGDRYKVPDRPFRYLVKDKTSLPQDTYKAKQRGLWNKDNDIEPLDRMNRNSGPRMSSGLRLFDEMDEEHGEGENRKKRKKRARINLVDDEDGPAEDDDDVVEVAAENIKKKDEMSDYEKHFWAEANGDVVVLDD
ncbi:S-adenosyl-L-methionine-dependent methyltransferase [Massariosphaeria phaeospora]|uniref:DNA (cytosine-5-)-methyltransferase n=1 Tax=Massariosphaeria phaeospora TaxID=100035 RepID=A0A7C8MBQ6_9PLEO|nr:S-adenosyl-L-methionine-dependent methyltransferase [Massariosphaeria phaeospora]